MSMLSKRIGDLQLPVIGLGTYDLKKSDMSVILKECVSHGVNYIDSANRYENEYDIGSTLRKTGISRGDIFIGTKLSYKQQIQQSVEESVDESLQKLQMDYIDLYMIHSPKSKTYCQDWVTLLDEKRKGKIRELAVSNFSVSQIDELYKVSGVYPVLNQIEVNLVHAPWDVIDFCLEHNIAVQASCPLYRMREEVVNRTSVLNIVARYNKTYSQIVLKWLYQRGVLSIPKMSSKEHLLENIDIFDFELSENDLKLLENLQLF